MSQHRLAFAATLALAVMAAACDNKSPAGTASSPKPPKASTLGKVSPSPTPTPDETVPTKATPTPSPAPTPTATPTPVPTATPTATPAVAVSAPPIAFPYTKQGAGWSYSMKVDVAALFKISITGSATIAVADATATGADLTTSFTLDGLTGAPAGFDLPNKGKATSGSSQVAKDVQNPYGLGVLFPKAGEAETDTVTASTSESVTVPAGTFTATKYTISAKVGTDTQKITLWVDADGSMLQEIVAGSKPPSSLVDTSAFGSSGALFANAATTTTFALTAKTAADAGATSTAGATATATPGASATATADAGGTP